MRPGHVSTGIWSAQSIRGKAALSRSAKEPYVTRHGIFNWLALFSLVGAGATIYLVRGMRGKSNGWQEAQEGSRNSFSRDFL